MTLRTPLVIGADGLVQQLQAGDSILATTSTTSVRQVTNGETTLSIGLGTPVYATGADTVKRAQANAKSTSVLVGIGYDPVIAPGAIGNIAESGTVVGTTQQWDSVAGTSGGLSFGVNYFLDPSNPGKLTSTPPSAVGQVNVLVGRALSTTELEVLLRDPILL